MDAQMLSTSYGQVVALLPSSTPVGEGTVTLTYQGKSSKAVPIRVARSGFGIATRNGAGTGPGVVRNLGS